MLHTLHGAGFLCLFPLPLVEGHHKPRGSLTKIWIRAGGGIGIIPVLDKPVDEKPRRIGSWKLSLQAEKRRL
jgi:hypothetical protein